MITLQRLVKLGYVLALGSAVLVLSHPAPVRAQRTLAYPFLPGPITTAISMSQLLATAGTPMVNYNQVQQMLQQAGNPAGLGVGGGPPQQSFLGGNGVGMGGGMRGIMGMGGGMMGMGGGMMGMRGGIMGGGMRGMGGMMGMGGFPMGGMGGGFGGMRGFGGMGGFAGKGFGGFNGKKPL